METRRAIGTFRTLTALVAATCLTPSVPAWAGSTGIMALQATQGNVGLVHAVSADGSVAVGYRLQDGRRIPFRWSLSSGTMTLGYVNPGSNPNSEAKGVSDNGHYAVGTERFSWFNMQPTSVGFRWAPPGTLEGLGFGGGFHFSAANAVSNNNVAVGYVPSHLHPERGEATIWTRNQQLSLGFMEPIHTFAWSGATGVSADGSVVVGSGSATTGHRAFRWTEQTGMVPLELLPGQLDNYAQDVSADGSVIVGQSRITGGRTIFRWTESTGMVDLGRLPGTNICDEIRTSGDGSVLVGNCDGVPFIWTQDFGLQRLVPTLQSYYGIDLSGWVIGAVGDVSTDGQFLVGFGSYNGVLDGFRVQIPEPASLPLLFAGLFLARRRRFATK